MGKLKKLRRRAEKLAYLVEIAEQEARLAELRQGKKPTIGFTQAPSGAHGTLIGHPDIEEGEMIMGGKPSKGTRADRRLKENKGKPAPAKPMPTKKK